MSAACAVSDGTEDHPAEDSGASIPTIDGGAEASADAALPALPCATGNLCTVRTPLAYGSITAIGGRGGSDVWASGSRGAILHFDGQQWSMLESDLSETISSLIVTPDEIWGIAGSLVLRRGLDPSSVRRIQALLYGTFSYRSASAIAVLSSEDVYLGIAPGWMGASESYFAKLDMATGALSYPPPAIHPVTGEMQQSVGTRALYMVPEKALWLVGDHAAVVRYPVSSSTDGGAPTLGRGVIVPIASQTNLLAAWAYEDHLWAAGERGTILHFDGSKWNEAETGSTSILRAIFGLSPTDIWAAGDDGTVLHFDGDRWSSIRSGASGSLVAIWGSASDDIWIGGEAGMFHWGALP